MLNETLPCGAGFVLRKKVIPMSKKLLIDARQSDETRVVVLNNNKLEDFDYETSHRKQLKGNIYLARVTRVEPSLQAAFVEYGGNRQGFLAFSEIHPDYYRIPIEDREKLLAEEEDRANAEAAADNEADADADADNNGDDNAEENASSDASSSETITEAINEESISEEAPATESEAESSDATDSEEATDEAMEGDAGEGEASEEMEEEGARAE